MFAGLANGQYTVTPTENGYTFNPQTKPLPLAVPMSSGINFTAVAPSNSITLDVSTSRMKRSKCDDCQSDILYFYNERTTPGLHCNGLHKLNQHYGKKHLRRRLDVDTG